MKINDKKKAMPSPSWGTGAGMDQLSSRNCPIDPHWGWGGSLPNHRHQESLIEQVLGGEDKLNLEAIQVLL